MKNSSIVILLFLLLSPGKAFGDGNPFIDNFNEYVNSPANSAASSVNKSIDLNHAPDHKARKNIDKAEAKPMMQGIPANWQTCTRDSDCTAGVADCVTWEALNKKYVHRLAKYLNSCSASIDPGFQPQAVCQAKECITTEKDTDVSWEDWLSEMHQEKSVSP